MPLLKSIRASNFELLGLAVPTRHLLDGELFGETCFHPSPFLPPGEVIACINDTGFANGCYDIEIVVIRSCHGSVVILLYSR